MHNSKITKFINRFAYDQELSAGQLAVSSNYPSYKDIPMGERFEIYVRYHHKIQGKKEIKWILMETFFFGCFGQYICIFFISESQ